MGLRLVSVAAVVSLTLAACSDATGPLGSSEGIVRFSYTGAETGVWQARGVRYDDWGATTHAAGLRYAGSIIVIAHARKRGGRADGFWLSATATEPGTYAIGDIFGSAPVRGGLSFDNDHSTNTSRAVYDFVSGSVTFEQNTDGRIRGQFEALAQKPFGSGTLTVTGSFDVPNNMEPPQDLASRLPTF
jgi:hypothetical protein